MSKPAKNRAAFEASNREAASIVAADPAKYPAGSLLAEWARLVLQGCGQNLSPIGDNGQEAA